VAALTSQHIITSSVWASVADDTQLFTHQCFSFLIHNHVTLENIHEHFNEQSFLHNHDELLGISGLAGTEKDIAMKKLIV